MNIYFSGSTVAGVPGELPEKLLEKPGVMLTYYEIHQEIPKAIKRFDSITEAKEEA